MSDKQHITVWVEIEGLVQGVAFRDWTQRTAAGLRLTGWVRNRRSGKVEALFAGPEVAVDKMVELCWQGPPAARVSAVRANRLEVPERPASFQIQPTL